jgi:hypothetical protein
VQRRARGHLHGGGADLVAGVAQHLGGHLGVALAQVSHQDLLAGADPPGDGLTNRPGADDDRDLAHGDLGPRCWVHRPSLLRSLGTSRGSANRG